MDPHEIIAQLVQNIERVIVGKTTAIKLCLAALLSQGHILIEDVPGLGKTMLARALAASISGTFRRIQFTPDLLPSDVTGVSIYNQKTQEFEPRTGPVFSHIVLADEINRTTPRTQSGLLEAMQEGRVTIDGVTYKLPQPFFVMATQNPIEFHGTYPLPEAQLDRFLLKINIGYPSEQAETAILERQLKGQPIDQLEPVTDLAQILHLQRLVTDIYVSPDVLNFITKVVRCTRSHPDIALGASPRGSLALTNVGRAVALLEHRDYVMPEDIKFLSPFVLSHRILLKAESEVEGKLREQVISEILHSVAVPM